MRRKETGQLCLALVNLNLVSWIFWMTTFFTLYQLKVFAPLDIRLITSRAKFFYSISIPCIESSCFLRDIIPSCFTGTTTTWTFPRPPSREILVSTLETKWKPSFTGFLMLTSQIILMELTSTSTGNFSFPCDLILKGKVPGEVSPPFITYLTVCAVWIFNPQYKESVLIINDHPISNYRVKLRKRLLNLLNMTDCVLLKAL